MPATFKKYERLSSQKTIETIFAEGSNFFVHPFKVGYTIPDKQRFCLQVAIAVPKKKTKSAVKRNHVKRLFREAWRQEKHRLIETLNQNKSRMAVFLVYAGTYENADFHEFRDKIIVILTRLQNELNAKSKAHEE